ncbi:hypothetical protein AMJ40_01990 [candidate division TA06 bacterium DG_26]|uniref:YvlB/LiaX N-terminal domain-containing protein n=1 Tax=candidate division TA06 bacterium DG_26 TaxID=1703771 RepID=A0A0S7WKQ6_UNCT6|nr:MAG: hypothetical protein AMJ40_01990 [candidate division TA06 bacterium DG_26]
MREEKLKILQMLEKGKVSAVEAAHLLDALERSETAGDRARWLRIRVYEKDKDQPKVKINLPFSLLRLLARVGKLKEKIPETVHEQLREKGIELSEEGLENLDTVIHEMSEKGKVMLADVIDEEKGQKVEIYIE